ncbi:hypothetical protein QL996_03245 [Planococcus sp. APC 4015]|nr:hypothetical protein [Planococcus sp. APC 4015]
MSRADANSSDQPDGDKMSKAREAVERQPFVDTDGELDDSADSYVSPARKPGPHR